MNFSSLTLYFRVAKQGDDSGSSLGGGHDSLRSALSGDTLMEGAQKEKDHRKTSLSKKLLRGEKKQDEEHVQQDI